MNACTQFMLEETVVWIIIAWDIRNCAVIFYMTLCIILFSFAD